MLELNSPAGSCSEAPFANVSFTALLYVSPVHTMPPRENTGVPLHFHSSTISGSALWIISRTVASIFPRQSPSSLIFSSINTAADFSETRDADFIEQVLSPTGSGSRTQCSPARHGLQLLGTPLRHCPCHVCIIGAMHFSDLALSKRLERAEGHACLQYAEARRRLFPGSGADWIV